MRRLLAVLLVGAAIAPLRAVPPEIYQAIHAPLECEAAAISPDGKWLGCILRESDAAVVRVIDLDATKATASMRVDLDPGVGSSFDRVFWVSTTRVVAQIGQHEIVAVDADGRNARRLVNWEQQFWYDEKVSLRPPGVPRTVRVIAWSVDAPEFVYVEAGRLRSYSVARVHHGTGKTELAWEGNHVSPVAYDRRGVLRVRVSDTEKPDSYEVCATGERGEHWANLDHALGSDARPESSIKAANIHGPRSVPLGFGSDPHVLFFASNVGRDRMGILAVDLQTGRRTGFSLDHPTHDLPASVAFQVGDATLVRERRTGEVVGARIVGQPGDAVWADADLGAVQDLIEKLVPDHRVQIENWDDARERFLVLLSHRADPGGFAVFTRADGKVRRLLDRSKKLMPLPAVHSTAWTLKRPNGAMLTGNLTLPAGVRNAPAPVVVVFPRILWQGVLAEYSGEIRELAEMGCAVLEVSHRGTLGRGLSHWEAAKEKLDRVIVDDVFAAIDRIGQAAGLDCGKVALVGSRFGAILALKLAQQTPERVACVVAEGPIPDLFESTRRSAVTYPSMRQRTEARRWFLGRTDEQLKVWAPQVFVPHIPRPMMFVTIEESHTFPLHDPTFDVIDNLRRAKKAPHVLRESPANGRAEMRARIGAAMEKFFAEHLPATAR